MTKRTRTHAESIGWRCVVDAKKQLGDGWKHVSVSVQWGLVCAEVLSVIAGQHWLSDPDATDTQLAQVARYAHELWRAVAMYRDRGWRL